MTEERQGAKPIHLILDICDGRIRSGGGEDNQDGTQKATNTLDAEDTAAKNAENGSDEPEVAADEGQEIRQTTTPPPGIIPVQDPNLFDKLFVTFCASGTQLSLNLSMRILGPSLLDLSELYGVQTSAIVKTLGMRAPAYVLGAALAGWLYKKVNRVVIMATCLFCLGLTLLLIPSLPSVTYFYPLMIMQGLSLGVVDPGSSTQAMDAWGAKSGPFLQVTYAGYGIGALLAPQIARPFLSEARTRTLEAVFAPVVTTKGRLIRDTDQSANNTAINATTNASSHTGINNGTVQQMMGSSPPWDKDYIEDVGHDIWSLLSQGLTPLWAHLANKYGRDDNGMASQTRAKRENNGDKDDAPLPFRNVEENRISNAFFLASGVDFFFAAAFLGFFIFRPYVRFTESLPKKTTFDVPQVGAMKEEPSAKKKLLYRFLSDDLVDPRIDHNEGGWDLKNHKRWGLLGLAGLFLFILVGVQILVSMAFVSFLVMNPKIAMSRRQAADVDTIFWAVFTLARTTAVAVAWFLTAHDIATFCLLVVLSSSVMLSVFPTISSDSSSLRIALSRSGGQKLLQGLILAWAAGVAPLAGALFTFIKIFTVVSHEEASFLFAVIGMADFVPFFLGGWIIEPDPTREAFLYCLAGLIVALALAYAALYVYGHYVLGIMPNAVVPKRRLPCKRSAADE